MLVACMKRVAVVVLDNVNNNIIFSTEYTHKSTNSTFPRLELINSVRFNSVDAVVV